MELAASRMGGLKTLALDLLFPPQCVGCGAAGQFICPECALSLPRINPPVCPVCGKPQPQPVKCPSCWGRNSTIDGVRSPFTFGGAIRSAIHDLKYHNVRVLATPLASLMAQYWNAENLVADVLVPVPLHAGRLRERGYNQSALLARELGKIVLLPVEEHAVLRKLGTAPQARTTSVEQRQQNVEQAFSGRPRSLRGKRVMLIDDVCTSGATLDSCARAAHTAGATMVWGLALARET